MKMYCWKFVLRSMFEEVLQINVCIKIIISGVWTEWFEIKKKKVVIVYKNSMSLLYQIKRKVLSFTSRHRQAIDSEPRFNVSPERQWRHTEQNWMVGIVPFDFGFKPASFQSVEKILETYSRLVKTIFFLFPFLRLLFNLYYLYPVAVKELQMFSTQNLI